MRTTNLYGMYLMYLPHIYTFNLVDCCTAANGINRLRFHTLILHFAVAVLAGTLDALAYYVETSAIRLDNQGKLAPERLNKSGF